MTSNILESANKNSAAPSGVNDAIVEGLFGGVHDFGRAPPTIKILVLRGPEDVDKVACLVVDFLAVWARTCLK